MTGSAPSTLAIGLFFNNSLTNSSGVRDVRITDNAGGTATGTRAVFGNIDALFFTISGATSGTVFTVSDLAFSPSDQLEITGITFDTQVP